MVKDKILQEKQVILFQEQNGREGRLDKHLDKHVAPPQDS